MIIVEADLRFEPDIFGDVYLIFPTVGFYFKQPSHCTDIFDGEPVGFSIDFGHDAPRLEGLYLDMIVLIARFDGDLVSRDSRAVEAPLVHGRRGYFDIAFVKFVGLGGRTRRPGHVDKIGRNEFVGAVLVNGWRDSGFCGWWGCVVLVLSEVTGTVRPVPLALASFLVVGRLLMGALAV